MNSASSSRAYRQTARAESAAATGQRIVEAFLKRLGEQWYDEITLEQVAADATVSVQTIVRRFGGKDGLIVEAINTMILRAGERRITPLGDAALLVRNLVGDYESAGDTILRLLAVEHRHPALHEPLTLARRLHRDWIAKVFAADLDTLGEDARQAVLDALVIATDVYTWKLLRRDMGRDVAATQDIITGMICSTLGPGSSGSAVPFQTGSEPEGVQGVQGG